MKSPMLWRAQFLVLLLFISFTSAQNAHAQHEVFQQGERLTYVAYYGFIALGEFTSEVVSVRDSAGLKIVKAVCEMKSYSGIPLVTVNSRYETEMIFDGRDVHSRFFTSVDYRDEDKFESYYSFDYVRGIVKMRGIRNGTVEVDRPEEFDKNLRFQDGLSLFYQARLSSYSAENQMIPVFMNMAQTSVSYFFSSKKVDIEVDVLEKDLQALRCEGNAKFKAILGLTGEFEGWFSNDKARVPLEAQLNITLGSISLELKSFSRNGWNP